MTPPRFQILVNVSTTWTPLRYRDATLTLPATPIAWRLLGSNHRELGRSAMLFHTVEDCREAITELVASVPEVRSGVAADVTQGLWSWRVGDEVVPSAVSSRLYQRRREAAHSLMRTLQNIVLVDREPEVLPSRPEPRLCGRIGATRPIGPTRYVDLRESRAAVATRLPDPVPEGLSPDAP